MATDFGNFGCCICGQLSAKWSCQCGDFKLCETCVPTHLSKKTSVHHIVPIGFQDNPELGVSSEDEGAKSLIESEIHRLKATEADIQEQLDRKEESIHDTIRTLFQRKKLELAEAIQQIEEFLNGLITDSEALQKIRGHSLFSLSVKFGELIKEGETVSFELGRTLGETKVYRHAQSLREKWNFKGNKIDAISLTVDRPVQLLAVGLPKTLPNQSSTILQSFQVLEGRSTAGVAVYSHQTNAELTSDKGDCSVVKLQKPVNLQPGRTYTIKAVLVGGSTFCIKEVNACKESDEAQFQLMQTEFGPGDVSNASTVDRGIFLEFHYFE